MVAASDRDAEMAATAAQRARQTVDFAQRGASKRKRIAPVQLFLDDRARDAAPPAAHALALAPALALDDEAKRRDTESKQSRLSSRSCRCSFAGPSLAGKCSVSPASRD